MSTDIDPIATRRYLYALAEARAGEWLAAAEVLEQALELAPRWTAAWFALGEAREKLGEEARAADAFGHALAFDAEDPHGAAARLALVGGGRAVALPSAYVARLFDQYAARFDAHLKSGLAYHGPEIIADAIDRVAPGRRFARGLDLGCGTGLAGAKLRDRIDELVGVDLSPLMIAEARAGGNYDRLEIGEVAAFLDAERPGRADLIVAADVLVYFGDLAGVFAAVARALAPDGLFVFTLEAREPSVSGEGFRLGATMRFAHSLDHVAQAIEGAGLHGLALDRASARREGGREVPGWIGTAHGG